MHFFDLDGTLIQTDAKWWIIDKNNPDKYIIKISQYEGSLIISGFYKKDNHYFKYNGIEGWISHDLWFKILKIKSIDIKNIGISWREFSDVKMIENQADKLIFLDHHINHIKNTKDIVNILTARGNKEAHKLIIDKILLSLNDLNININDEYFVNDIEMKNILGTSAVKKCLVLLQSIVGYKIDKDKFVPISIDKFDKCYFYDDEDINIEKCLDINNYMNLFLNKTMPKLRDIILKDIENRKPILYTHLVTSNKLNPFLIKEIKIG